MLELLLDNDIVSWGNSMQEEPGEKPTDQFDLKNSKEFLREIGATSLVDEIAKLEIAAHYAELTAIRNHYLTSVDLHQLKEDRQLDDVKSINADFINHSVNYNNIVAGLGYAGFIALLSIVSSMVFLRDFLTSALLLGVSLLAFVIWTTVQGYLFVRVVKKTTPLFALPEDEFDRRVILEKFQAADHQRTMEFAFLQRFWATSFLFSLITGFLAAAILFISLAIKILGGSSGFVDHLFNWFGSAGGILI